MNRGFLYALAAYLAWGLLPIYWKTLKQIPALELLGHRVFWCLVLVGLVLTVRRQWSWLHGVNRTVLLTFAAASLLLGLNWFTYIWAVNSGFVVETSLGYFINPLVNVLLGAVLLGERLRPFQWGAVSLATAGVLYLTFSYGALPWIALTLAFTFAFYGLIKKQVKLASLNGLSLEMAILLLPALVYLGYTITSGGPTFIHVSPLMWPLLIGTGVVTAVPLLFFASAARRITLTSLGLLQYLAPTLQLCLGVFVFNEPFDQSRLIGFGLIWLALILYSSELLVSRRRRIGPRAAQSTVQAAVLGPQHGED